PNHQIFELAGHRQRGSAKTAPYDPSYKSLYASNLSTFRLYLSCSRRLLLHLPYRAAGRVFEDDAARFQVAANVVRALEATRLACRIAGSDVALDLGRVDVGVSQMLTLGALEHHLWVLVADAKHRRDLRQRAA